MEAILKQEREEKEDQGEGALKDGIAIFTGGILHSFSNVEFRRTRILVSSIIHISH